MSLESLIKDTDINVKGLIDLPEHELSNIPTYPFGIEMTPFFKNKILKDVDYIVNLSSISKGNLYTFTYHRSVAHLFPEAEISKKEDGIRQNINTFLPFKKMAVGFENFYDASTHLANIKLMDPDLYEKSGIINDKDLTKLFNAFIKFKNNPENTIKNNETILKGYIDFLILGKINKTELNPKRLWNELKGSNIAESNINRALQFEPITNIYSLINLKLLFPEIFNTLGVLKNKKFEEKMKEKLRRIIEQPDRDYTAIGVSDSELPVFFYFMQILSCDDLKLSSNGLELFWEKPKSPTLNPLPKERNF